MIMIGERINASRSPIRHAIEKRDGKFIQEEAKAQAGAGCQFLDLNCGLSHDKEINDMEWLVETVQAAVDTPLCIDSPNPKAVIKGVLICRSKALVNSITAQKDRYRDILPVALEKKSGIVALTIDEGKMPEDSDGRVRIAEKIYKILKSEGVDDGDIYFDPLIRPISSEPRQAREVIRAIPKIKALGGVKVVCGLSNISFGLPKRSIINSTFLAIAIFAGMDAALIDPLDKRVMASIGAAEAILGADRYCMNYIQGHRKGLF